MAVDDYQIKAFLTDQHFCDIADEVLKVLVAKNLTLKETKYVLEKACKAVENSADKTRWGESLACLDALNDAPFVRDHEAVKAEVNRRKGLENEDES